ncbi:unnamed protein product [Prorocentrum cordatum]|uniref:TraB domain-containing protein n=1 Tax=Prorocentrum cordatum TaxID=2364126 RepID=A0ABN9Q544_9DINO|nr:unnamed protein product [Polarella glacialis]
MHSSKPEGSGLSPPSRGSDRPVGPRPRRWGWGSVKRHAGLNPETVSYLRDSAAEREVYLIGTSHVSRRSADDVRDAIHAVQPDRVLVELCRKRAKRLRSAGSDNPGAGLGKKILRDLQGLLLRSGARPGLGVEVLMKLGFAGLYAVLRQYGLVPGVDFRAALEEADRRGLPVCYGDRDIDQTLGRLREALSEVSWSLLASPPPPPPELERVLGEDSLEGLSSFVERLKNRRQIAAFRDYLCDVMPGVMAVMVRQRDVSMAEELLVECPPGRIVAVVGMAHMDGIEQEWQRCGGEVFLHTDNSMRF